MTVVVTNIHLDFCVEIQYEYLIVFVRTKILLLGVLIRFQDVLREKGGKLKSLVMPRHARPALEATMNIFDPFVVILL